jgi:MSHA pilin protein MshA
MKTKGFTLIELVVVIIVVGVLAATAVPKFVNLKPEAQTSTLQGVKAAMEGVAAMVYGKSLIAGNHTKATAQIKLANGTDVEIVYGYPNANGTQWQGLLELSDYFASEDFTTDGSFIVYIAENSTPNNATNDCIAFYLPATVAGQKPVINVNDCT